MVYGIDITLAKVAVLLQFIRLFVGTKRDFVFYGIHIILWSNVLFYVIVTFLEIFECLPREKIWNPTVPGRCINRNANWNAIAIWNTFSDFTILILPLVAIWNLQIARKRKLGIAAIFATGLL